MPQAVVSVRDGEAIAEGIDGSVKRLLAVEEQSGAVVWLLASRVTPQRLLPSHEIAGVVIATCHVPGHASGRGEEMDALLAQYVDDVSRGRG